MSNIIECRKCNKSFISEEFDSHTCEITIIKTETIFYDKLIQTTKDGNDVIVVLSQDGTLYNIKPANRLLTGQNNNRRLDRTCFRVLSTQ
ncbi:MAG: hypothetical protein ACREA8_05030 [Nitrosotalea sp.]